jgi:hypothetical protein
MQRTYTLQDKDGTFALLSDLTQWSTKSVSVVYDNDIIMNEIVNTYYNGVWMRAKW